MTITNLTARAKALKALQIIKSGSPELLATRPNLYKQCLDGVATFEALRPRVTPQIGPGYYFSLSGQQSAALFAAATRDNVLTVLIHETADHKWAWDVVTDIPGLVFGSPTSEPCATREEAEQDAVSSGLGMLGVELISREGYEPVPEADTKRQIVLNDCTYIVRAMPREWVICGITEGMREFSLSTDALLASFANTLLRDRHPSYAAKVVLLTLLNNCGWTHVTQEVLDDFCAANGIDMSEMA